MIAYTDDKFHFSINIPEDWIRQPSMDIFTRQGGLIALEHPENGAINISCNPLDSRTPIDKEERTSLLLDFLRKSPGATGSPVSNVPQVHSSKDNIATAIILTQGGYKGIISMVRGNTEYVIQYNSKDQETLKVQDIIFSFRFTNNQELLFQARSLHEQIHQHSDDWTALLRQFLFCKDAKWLNQAIASLQQEDAYKEIPRNESIIGKWTRQLTSGKNNATNSKILVLLLAWQQEDFPSILRKAPHLINQLLSTRPEAARTLALLYHEIYIQAAEGHLLLPNQRQFQASESGIDACVECVEISRQLNDRSGLANYLVRLGNGLYSAARFSEAGETFDEALNIWLDLAARQPELEEYSLQMVITTRRLGDVWRERMELTKSYVAYNTALTFLQIRVHQSSYHRLELARVLNNLGILDMKRNNKLQPAETEFEESLKIFRDLVSGQSQSELTSLPVSVSPLLELEMSLVLSNLASVTLKQVELKQIKKIKKDYKIARDLFEEAISIQQKLELDGRGTMLLHTANSLVGLGKTLYFLGIEALDNENGELSMQLFKDARNALENALSIQARYPDASFPIHIQDKVNALITSGTILGKLGDFKESRRLLENAIQICKDRKLWLSLAEAYQGRAAIEAWVTDDLLGGFLYDEQAVQALEKGLAQLSSLERLNRGIFKGKLEIAYAVCIAHYAKNHELEKTFYFLESLQNTEALSDPSLEPVSANKKIDLSMAQKLAVDSKFAYLAIHVIPGGMVFFAILPSGDIEVHSISKGWRGTFFKAFEDINESIQNIITTDNEDQKRLTEETKRLKDLGRELFEEMPEKIKDLLIGDARYIFLSPQGELQNLPFDFLFLPSGEWLGLKQVLPRVHSFSELTSVISRQPKKSSRLSMIICGPNNDLSHAGETVVLITKKLSTLGFDHVPNGEALLGETATIQNFTKGLNSKISFCLYCGHGGFDEERGGFLALGDGNYSPLYTEHIVLDGNPIVHYDCCQAGVTGYLGGGESSGLGHLSIEQGASCCLLANRLVFDEHASSIAKLFYTKLLEENKTTGEALLETRREFSAKYPSPLGWAFPTLFGNPDARLAYTDGG